MIFKNGLLKSEEKSKLTSNDGMCSSFLLLFTQDLRQGELEHTAVQSLVVGKVQPMELCVVAQAGHLLHAVWHIADNWTVHVQELYVVSHCHCDICNISNNKIITSVII